MSATSRCPQCQHKAGARTPNPNRAACQCDCHIPAVVNLKIVKTPDWLSLTDAEAINFYLRNYSKADLTYKKDRIIATPKQGVLLEYRAKALDYTS